MTDHRRSLGHDLGIVLVGTLWLLAPAALLYLVGWYVSDSPTAARLISGAILCYGVVAALFFAMMVWFFWTTEDSRSFAQATGVSLSLGMMLPFGLLALVILTALCLKWVS